MVVSLRTGVKWLAGICLGFAAEGTVSAQCNGGCGPRVCNSYTGGNTNCGIHGLKQYPLSEKHYIAQFCGPHIVPGSCFGYFKPQITQWGQACPNYMGEPDAYFPQPPIYAAPAQPEPIKEKEPDAPKEAPKNTIPPVTPKTTEVPKTTLPTVPKVDQIPAKPPSTPLPSPKLPGTTAPAPMPMPVIPSIPKVEALPMPPTIVIPSEVPVTVSGY